jgi:hypothetical protein
MITSLLRRHKQQASNELKNRKPDMIKGETAQSIHSPFFSKFNQSIIISLRMAKLTGVCQLIYQQCWIS